MKPECKRKKIHRANFLVLFVISATFLVLLSKNLEINALVILYAIFGDAITEIAFDIGKDESGRVRAILWMLLNIILGIGIAIYLFSKMELLLGSVVVFFILFMTIADVRSMKRV